MEFKLSESYVINSQDYEQEGLRIAVLAQSGHGKSYLAAKIVEDALTQNFQVLVVEPIAEWHSLKAKFNSIAVIGGEFQDLPLVDPRTSHPTLLESPFYIMYPCLVCKQVYVF